MYDLLFRHVLRHVPAESAHQAAFALLRAAAGPLPFGRVWAAVRGPVDPVLRTQVMGIDFPGPVGLAAGFDKDAEGVRALARLGFGFVEIGTVTARPQPGNPKPRLFRLPDDHALINRMGFNNEGAENVAARLRALRNGRGEPIVLGVNIGKSKAAPSDQAVDDYVRSATLLGPFADYLVVNVSSPNTPGLRDLQQVSVLEPLLTAVRQAMVTADPTRRVPLLVKITTDLASEDIDAVADLALHLGLDGVIATNTTVSRSGLQTPQPVLEDIGRGGVSGRPLSAPALAIVRRLRERLGPGLPIISVGGIETAQDAYERIRAGACLVQAYTGFIYGGARWPVTLCRELAALLRADGFERIADAVGVDAPS
ncbi:quinone-dependent dihydroorotate dehydrogenase [Pseudonocardia asaccharolytica]|uniref:Dihydroorotate dehydrogenase (quinone) n=1 Tax=Pseudonocardia asaccharolytica DSM 44247 = NBRC 16224 TaxID=1123024 RepID=A0A511CZH5_9PSEU|nr:quinone-dependent dihydroorotate dehydrogenase [Pseudonocardia asaccharolytica]GEL17939.1 dihydroorotate dehydrogenase (quinone) [Pseudonocardia asaccharolytica DSM 44247 = NBRC 16224]